MKVLHSIYNRMTRLQVDETLALILIASLVGLACGAGVWLFKQVIAWGNTLFFGIIGGALRPLGGWTALLVPALGGLVIGLMAIYLIGPERHHGVAGIMEAVALAGGRLRYRRMPIKTLAAGLGIGSGASVGPEDPSVQIGANIGSFAGQKLHLSDERVGALVAAGAAAGISAAFNAPIAGVFFALEVVLGEISGGSLGVIVLASVVSAVFTQAVSGAQPAFQIPAYTFQGIIELPLYLALGILSGPVAALYSRGLYLAQDLFLAWRVPGWVKTMTAGLLVGLTSLVLPQILGVGYGTIETILQGQSQAVAFLLALMFAKLAMTAISIGGGFLGGVFAPSLFLGAALGAAVGTAADQIFPGLPVTPPAFALVGMGAVLAGAAHAPLTAILLLFEMTNDYRIILPLMFAVIISLLISQRLQRDSVYTLGLARKGIRLERGRDVDVLQALQVGEVMRSDLPALRAGQTLAEAYETLVQTHHHGLPVVDSHERLMGILTLQDIEKARQQGRKEARVGEVCTRDLIIAFLDESVGAALRRMSARDIGRIPVVSRSDSRRLVGVLRRNDIIRAYDLALARRAELRHRASQVRLGAISDEQVSITEIQIEPGAECAGKSIREVHWPPECVIASVRRGRRFLIPHGDTVLRSGDILVAVAEDEAREALETLCRSQT